VAAKYSIECWMLGRDGLVLLLQVPARPGEHEPFWQPVTGGIEAGETRV
jgi:dihydroneopterin triphosphate diphosphatase